MEIQRTSSAQRTSPSMNHLQNALQIFEQAIELPPDEVEAFLSEACGHSVDLRNDVESLLSAHGEASSFLDTSNLLGSQENTDVHHEPGLRSQQQLRLKAGQRLEDRYLIQKSLGSGGMGEVYLSHDEVLHRDVAIKVLNLSHFRDSEMQERFEREIRVVAGLSHPNLVTLHDYRRDGELAFAVMEFVNGQTLLELIQDGLEIDEVVRIAGGIASGIAAAHTKNLMHRDIKPANVMISSDGQVKLLDFGLARPVDLEGDMALTANDSVLPGTVPYMSPEQASGEALTCATDIFSFGTVLYEMLRGSNPFRTTSIVKTLQNVANVDIQPLTNDGIGLPDSITQLVTAMLQKNAERRPTASQLESAFSEIRQSGSSKLESSLSTEPTPSVSSNLPRRRVELQGRVDQMAALNKQLSQSPVTTIVGPGGVGKTSLAIALAQERRDEYPGGVWLCELASMHDANGVLGVVAGVLDGNAGSTSGLEEVFAPLNGKPSLLILDNCEHVIEGAAEFAESASERVDGLTILATSRESLGIRDESLLRLEGLGVTGQTSDAALLFASRAAAQSVQVDLNQQGALVEKIVEKLEGLPLAIELAASRLTTMSLEELHLALDDQLTTLQRGRRTRDRQSTLDNAIAWSFELLTPAEQKVLLQLAVFAAPFTIEAATHVCELKAGQRMLVERLVDQSVVARSEQRGQSRFRLLEPIRQFCDARCNPVEQQDAMKRHARFFAERAAHLGQGINGQDECNRASELNAEWPDLRLAIAWGREHQDVAIAVDPIVALARTIMFHLRTEAYLWLMEAYDRMQSELDDRGDVLWVIANGYWVMAQPERCEEFLLKSESHAVTPQTLWVRYFLRFSQNRFEESAAAAKRAEELSIESNDEIEQRWWSNAFRVCPLALHNPQDPEIDSKLEQSKLAVETVDWPTGKAFLALATGTVASARHDLPEVLRLHRETVDLARSCGNRWIELIAKLVFNEADREDIPGFIRLKNASATLHSLIDTGEEAHFPIAVRCVVMALESCGMLDEAAQCTSIVPKLHGVGHRNEFTPRYPEVLERIEKQLGVKRFYEQQHKGKAYTARNIAEIAAQVLHRMPNN